MIDYFRLKGHAMLPQSPVFRATARRIISIAAQKWPPLIFKGQPLILVLTIALMATIPIKNLRAETQTVCVICNDPNKVYQCNYNLPDTTGVSLNIKGLQFACIKEIAQYGEHGQCAAARNVNNNCRGEPYALKNAGGLYKPELENLTTTEQQEDEAAPPPAEKQQPPTLADETVKTYEKTKETVKSGYDKTKETVSEGYDKTSKTVKKTVNSVGKTINDAASTTYECLKSFFSDCGN